jgi:hypothetical protein
LRKRMHVLLALGLVLSLFVGVLGSASAEHAGSPVGDASSAHVYFPWVPNGSEIDGTGPWYGTVTLQNLENRAVSLDVYRGVGLATGPTGGWTLAETIVLAANGSITLSAATLGVPEPGAPVKVLGWLDRGGPVGDELQCWVIHDDGTHQNITGLLGGLPGDAIVHCAEIAAQMPGVVDSYILKVHRGEARPARFARIAGVQKQVSPLPSFDAKTSAAHVIVDGYTGLNGAQIDTRFQHVLPIIQTNNFWNTYIRLANFAPSGTGLTPYTITIYESFGSGAAGASVGEFTGAFRPGQVTDINIMDHPAIGPGFVGTAFITVNVPAAAAVERVKAVSDMLIMNTSRPILEDDAFASAPLIFQNWNNWNTGISVANTNPAANLAATINYHPPLSGVAVEHFNIPPRSMEWVYRPGTHELGIGLPDQTQALGAAKIQGNTTHHSAVDQVKYDFQGDDVDAGNAMSYIAVPFRDHATGAGVAGPFEAGDILALPLFQKGSPLTGLGDTSGIQFFNASADHSVTANIFIYDTTGNLVAPTLVTPITHTLAPHGNFTLYAHHLHELPVGFQGSVKVQVSGAGLLSAVSNNVNYAVQGDGAAAFNLVKVPGLPAQRVATSFTVSPPSDTNLIGDTHTITVTVFDQVGDPIAGVGVRARVTESSAGNQGVWLQPDPATTGANGVAQLSYTGANVGHDTITVWVDGFDPVTVSKTWQAYTLLLEPVLDRNPPGTLHTVTATLTDGFGQPANIDPGSFQVTIQRFPGADFIIPADLTVNVVGNVATVTYTGPGFPAIDVINARAETGGVEVASNTAFKVWARAIVRAEDE